MLIHSLADAFLAGESGVEAIVARCQLRFGRPWRWLKPLAERYVAAVNGLTTPRRREVAAFLRKDPGVHRAWKRHSRELRVEHWLMEPPEMRPVSAARGWGLP